MLQSAQIVFLLGIACVLCPSVLAQTPCNEIQSMPVNVTEMAGTWYELARNPGPVGPLLCAAVVFTPLQNNIVKVDTIYSNTPDYPWVNYTYVGNITVDNTGAGYNITSTYGDLTSVPTVYKLVGTDFANFAFVCGYQNESDPSTYFGIVLARDRFLNVTILEAYEAAASVLSTSFLSSGMYQIQQDPTCYESGALRTTPLPLAMLASCFVAVLKLNWL